MEETSRVTLAVRMPFLPTKSKTKKADLIYWFYHSDV
jgi:hypothetical protein